MLFLCEVQTENTDETPQVLDSALVSDIDCVNISLRELRIKALQHLKSGSDFLQVPHGQTPSNSYTDVDLSLLFIQHCFHWI